MTKILQFGAGGVPIYALLEGTTDTAVMLTANSSGQLNVASSGGGVTGPIEVYDRQLTIKFTNFQGPGNQGNLVLDKDSSRRTVLIQNMSTHIVYLYDNSSVDTGIGFPLDAYSPFQSVPTLGKGLELPQCWNELWVYSDIDVDLRLISYYL